MKEKAYFFNCSIGNSIRVKDNKSPQFFKSEITLLEF